MKIKFNYVHNINDASKYAFLLRYRNKINMNLFHVSQMATALLRFHVRNAVQFVSYIKHQAFGGRKGKIEMGDYNGLQQIQ